jgi:hypothetical protein
MLGAKSSSGRALRPFGVEARPAARCYPHLKPVERNYLNKLVKFYQQTEPQAGARQERPAEAERRGQPQYEEVMVQRLDYAVDQFVEDKQAARASWPNGFYLMVAYGPTVSERLRPDPANRAARLPLHHAHVHAFTFCSLHHRRASSRPRALHGHKSSRPWIFFLLLLQGAD